jgi:2-polyprenyl-3-methyl-5-hydroxy-6-metoxy-1,4-benzoquinol methylase
MQEDIIEYYTGYDERDRLEDRHSIELIRSKALILRHLPKDKNDIIDIGGAAGCYSFWLSSLGNTVSLIDLTPKHIEQAKILNQNAVNKLKEIDIGNALDLPYTDKTFDVSLLMGPLYHLLNKQQRIKAISEAIRVTKDEGVVIMSFISRFASMLDGFKYDFVSDREFRSILDKDLKSGKHINNTSNKEYFTTSYLHHSDEIEDEIKYAHGKVKKIYAIEGISNIINDIQNRIEDDKYLTYLLKKIEETEEDKSIIGISSHIMAIASKA